MLNYSNLCPYELDLERGVSSKTAAIAMATRDGELPVLARMMSSDLADGASRLLEEVDVLAKMVLTNTSEHSRLWGMS